MFMSCQLKLHQNVTKINGGTQHWKTYVVVGKYTNCTHNWNFKPFSQPVNTIISIFHVSICLGPVLTPSRSSGVRSSPPASAVVPWSPRPTTPRSGSLCHAGSWSREVPSYRPTAPTPTSSRPSIPSSCRLFLALSVKHPWENKFWRNSLIVC